MGWYQKVNHAPDFEGGQENVNDDIELRKVDTSHDHVPSNLDVVSQYLLSPIVIEDENTHMFLNIHSPEMETFVMEKVAPHFRSARGTYRKGKLIQIHLWNCKEESRDRYLQLNEAGRLHPFITDLRGRRAANVQHRYEVPKQLVYYKLLNDGFENVNSEDFEHLWWFLKNTGNIGGGKIVLMPTNWTFGEHLQQSIVLRSLSAVCEEIYMAVEQDNDRVFYLSCLPN